MDVEYCPEILALGRWNLTQAPGKQKQATLCQCEARLDEGTSDTPVRATL